MVGRAGSALFTKSHVFRTSYSVFDTVDPLTNQNHDRKGCQLIKSNHTIHEQDCNKVKAIVSNDHGPRVSQRVLGAR